MAGVAGKKPRVKFGSLACVLQAPHRREVDPLWIHIAKRTETRVNRIRESIRLLAAGKKLGLK